MMYLTGLNLINFELKKVTYCTIKQFAPAGRWRNYCILFFCKSFFL